MLHPADAAVANEAWPIGYPRGTVDANGSFRISTYEADDGAPEGDYQIVVLRSNAPRPSQVALDPAAALGDVRQAQTPQRTQPLQKPKNDPKSPVGTFTVEPKTNIIPRLELTDRTAPDQGA